MASGLNVYLKAGTVNVSLHGTTSKDIYVMFSNLKRPSSKVYVSLHDIDVAVEFADTLRKAYNRTAEFNADSVFPRIIDTVVFVQVRVTVDPSETERVVIFNSCDTELLPCETVVLPLTATERDTICNWIVRTFEYARKTLYDVDNMAEDCDV